MGKADENFKAMMALGGGFDPNETVGDMLLREVQRRTPARAMAVYDDWSARAQVEDDDQRSIAIMGLIGWDVTDRRVRRILQKAGPDSPITLDVNSPGGNFIDGLAIHNLIAEHRGHVTARVLGLAGSAAQLIVMGADTVVMSAGALQFLHNVWGLAIGDHRVMAEVSTDMEKMTDSIRRIVARRTGADLETVRGWLDADSLFDSKESVENGLANRRLDEESDEELQLRESRPTAMALIGSAAEALVGRWKR